MFVYIERERDHLRTCESKHLGVSTSRHLDLLTSRNLDPYMSSHLHVCSQIGTAVFSLQAQSWPQG